MVLPTQPLLGRTCTVKSWKTRVKVLQCIQITFFLISWKNWNTDKSKTLGLPKYRIGVSLKMSASPFSMSFSILSCLPEDRVYKNRMFTIY